MWVLLDGHQLEWSFVCILVEKLVCREMLEFVNAIVRCGNAMVGCVFVGCWYGWWEKGWIVGDVCSIAVEGCVGC